MKFRKKPVVIDAEQFKTNNEVGSPNMDAIVNWINQGNPPDARHAWHNGTVIFIQTLEGQMTADVGDWIIKGVKGEFYPCKPDIFAATYEAVEQ
jgi:quercetin dioxygenase-like cupin family protein